MVDDATNEYYDAGTIITSLEEKIDSLKEKINLVAKNFIELKEETNEKIEKIEKEIFDFKFKIEDIKKRLNSLIEETIKFVKKEDLILIERMIKDFQPLEFVRKKELEEILKNKEKL